MAPSSPSSPGSDSCEEPPVQYDSEPSSKTVCSERPSEHPTENEAQQSAFLKLPVDIFIGVTDYLDRDAAWCLKRLCRGMSKSKVVDEMLYKYPIQARDVCDIRLIDWKYKSRGRHRWVSFQQSINDSNRHYVQKIAMSHWCSIEDFKWVQDNLPCLTTLEVTAIKDFVWTPEETWTWKQLADACPALFARIDQLVVPNWTDYNSQARIGYIYSYNDYRFKETFRLSRRRDGGSIAKIIFPLCTKLTTLTIRDRYAGLHTWNEWEVHQRVCVLVDGIEKYCPPTLKKLRVYDCAPFRSLFATGTAKWANIEEVEIGLFSWMEDRRERDVMDAFSRRVTPGITHREEEEPFNDKTYETCGRDHIDVGQHVVAGDRANFDDLIQYVRDFKRDYPHIRLKPIDKARPIVLHPLHLRNVSLRRRTTSTEDPLDSHDMYEIIHWLTDKCGWKPVIPWDTMMCDVFPLNVDSLRPLLPKADLMARIESTIRTLHTLNVPIRISIGNRAHASPTSGLDGALYFGDYKCFVGEGDEKREQFAPTQARFNLAGIAPLIDELTITYPPGIPGAINWRTTHRIEAEKELLGREMRGWRLFFARYALLFKNLKKLTVKVPVDIFNDWGNSEHLRKLLDDEDWKVLDINEKLPCETGLYGSFLTFATARRYSLLGKKPRMRFVQKAFFRDNEGVLDLGPPDMTDEELEGREISDESIAVKDLGPHRFWPAKASKPKAEKRTADKMDVDKVDEGQAAAKKARVD